MPLINTFGALREQRYSVAQVFSNYWYSIFSLKNNNSTNTGFVDFVDNGSPGLTEPVICGTNGSGTDFRPYSTTFDITTGALDVYKVYTDITAIPFVNTITRLTCQDTSNNLYYFRSSFQVNKYDSSGVFVSGTTFLNSSSGTLTLNNAVKAPTIDSVYTISIVSNTFILTKIDLLTVSVNWSVQVSGITINNNTNGTPKLLYVDNVNNVYVTIYTSSTTTTTVFKFDSTGSLLWQVSTTAFTSVFNQSLATDSSQNVYLFGTGAATGVIINLNSSGVFQSARNCSAINGTGSYDGIIINSDNNICLLADYQAGALNFTRTCVMDTSYNIISSTQIAQGASVLMYPRSMVSRSGNLYMYCVMGTGGATQVANVLLKVPNNNTTYFVTPFSYNFTDDGGTNYNGSGTFTFTSATNPTLTSTTYTITTTAYTSAAYTVNVTTNSAPTLNTTTPYNTTGALV